jgi:superfamily II DNA helicase RecQ
MSMSARPRPADKISLHLYTPSFSLPPPLPPSLFLSLPYSLPPITPVAAVAQSTASLRKFASDTQSCRRRSLVSFFGETPKYDRCGTCDVCLAGDKHQDDMSRDFSKEAGYILRTVAACPKPLAMTKLVEAISGAGKGVVNAATADTLLKVRRTKSSSPPDARFR